MCSLSGLGNSQLRCDPLVFSDNSDYKYFSKILPRMLLHKSIYMTETKRQAEAAMNNGIEGILYEIDQNMKCVAGQTFNGVGTCINNGFSWPWFFLANLKPLDIRSEYRYDAENFVS